MDGVFSSKFSAPFQTAWYPNGGILKVGAPQHAYSGTLPNFWQWNHKQNGLGRTEPKMHCSVETRHKKLFALMALGGNTLLFKSSIFPCCIFSMLSMAFHSLAFPDHRLVGPDDQT
jgi:hypothetical protein